MATIPELVEDFMGGSPGATINFTNTTFDSIYGAGDSTIVTDPFDATRHMMQVSVSSNPKTHELTFPGVTTLWFRFDLDIDTPLNAATAILNGWDVEAGTNKVFDLRQNAGVRTLSLRDISTVVWTSTALASGTKHRIYVNVDLVGAKTIRCMIYSGGTLTTLSQDSGAITSTTAATSIGHLRIGAMTAATGILRMGALTGDDAVQPTGTTGPTWTPADSVGITDAGFAVSPEELLTDAVGITETNSVSVVVTTPITTLADTVHVTEHVDLSIERIGAFAPLTSPFTSTDRMTPGQVDAYHAGLCANHERRITINVLNLDGSHHDTLNLSTMDGSVAVTKPAPDAVSRVLTLNAVDAAKQLDFSPSSPGENVYFDRLLRVFDDRYIPDLGWVRATVFTGPVWTFKRTGNAVELTAHGKERLAMGSMWTPVTIHKGMNKVDAIRMLLELAGETRFDFPTLADKGHRMPEKRSLDRLGTPWAAAQKIARSLNRQLYYDGSGVCRLRTLPEKSSFRFVGGDGGSVLSEPEVNRDLSNFKNTWLVLGKNAKGSKGRASAVVKIPHDHPLSAKSLGRNGQPRVLAEKIEDTSLRSDKECQDLGEQRMADAIRGTVEASFDAAPIPDREVGDLCDLVLDEGAVSFRLWEFTLPLASGSMSVGKVKRTPRRRGRG